MHRLLFGSFVALCGCLCAGCGGGGDHPQGTGGGSGSGGSSASGGSTKASATDTGGSTGGGGGSAGSGGTKSGTNTQASSPPALSDDPTGITALPECALAQSGKCVKPLSRSKQELCDRWDAARALKTQSVWIAPADSCAPGTTPTDAQEDALRRINYARWLSDLEPVTLDPAWSSLASACAIVQIYAMAETGDITHYPATTTRCYTSEGGSASAQSQIAPDCPSPADCVDRLFWDEGDRNLHIDGHRKGLTAPAQRKVGIGFAAPGQTSAACVRTVDGPMNWPAGIAGLVTYPSFDRVPFQMVSRAGQPSLPPEPLEWSIALNPSTDLGTPKLRLFRQGSASYEAVAMDSGKTPKTEIGGLWMIPKQEPGPGTYVVLVEGTSLPEFGYRVILDRCGPELPSSCDVLKQDCGVSGYSCHDPDHSRCRPAGTIVAGQACKLIGDADPCVPGSECRPNFDGTGAHSCQPYCDPFSTTAANSCKKLCTKTTAEIWASDPNDPESVKQVGAFCSPADI